MRPFPTKPDSSESPVLVVGGTGRLGQLLRMTWGQSGRYRWQARQAPAQEVFDPLHDDARYAEAARGAGVIFNLAGVVCGDAGALALNEALALAALRAARAAGVSHVFLASSAAVYGRGEAGTDEASHPNPVSDYGKAKLAMEWAALEDAALLGGPTVCCLRIGNVAGADRLLGAGGGVPRLDTFADGTAPARSYVGPQALAALLGLIFDAAMAGRPIPPVLNVALAGAVGMDDLLAVDGRHWQVCAAPEGTIRTVDLDTTLLARTVGVSEPAVAARIVADLRALVPAPPRGDA